MLVAELEELLGFKDGVNSARMGKESHDHAALADMLEGITLIKTHFHDKDYHEVQTEAERLFHQVGHDIWPDPSLRQTSWLTNPKNDTLWKHYLVYENAKDQQE
jgi:hypothetical protein